MRGSEENKTSYINPKLDRLALFCSAYIYIYIYISWWQASTKLCKIRNHHQNLNERKFKKSNPKHHLI